MPAARARRRDRYQAGRASFIRVVQRCVQDGVSWQYQRTSAQALPPSGTSWSAGSRIPHIQHVSTAMLGAQATVDVCPLLMFTLSSGTQRPGPDGGSSAPSVNDPFCAVWHAGTR